MLVGDLLTLERDAESGNLHYLALGCSCRCCVVVVVFFQARSVWGCCTYFCSCCWRTFIRLLLRSLIGFFELAFSSSDIAYLNHNFDLS